MSVDERPPAKQPWLDNDREGKSGESSSPNSDELTSLIRETVKDVLKEQGGVIVQGCGGHSTSPGLGKSLVDRGKLGNLEAGAAPGT